MDDHHDTAQALKNAQHAADRLRLRERSELVARRATLLDGRSTPLQERLAADFIETVTAHEQQAATGFLPAPAHLIGKGDILAGYQKCDGAPIRLTLDEINRHIAVYGSSGSAKSSWVAFLLRQLPVHVKRWLFDPKDDARRIAIDTHALIIDHRTRLRVLQPPRFLTTGAFVSTITSTWARTHYGGSTFKGTMHDALAKLYASITEPCLADLKRLLDHLITKVFTFNMKDSVALAAYRLERFNALYPGIFNHRDGTTIEEALNGSAWFGSTGEDGAEWLFLFLLTLLLLRNRAQQHRTGALDTIVVIDEGLLLWSSQNNGKIDGIPLLAQLHTMVREFGIGIIVTSASIRLTDQLLRSNAYIQVAMNTTDASQEIGRAFALRPPEQAYYDFALTRGEFIIRLGDRWREPILATFPHLDQAKHVEPAIWNAAPRGIPPTTSTSTAPEPSTTGTTSDASPTPTPPSGKIALSDGKATYLRHVGNEIVAIVTAVNAALGLLPQVGQRYRNALVALGFLDTTNITVHARRGGNAVALSVTPAGYEWLGTRPRSTRGGDSVQHRWLVLQLCKRLGTTPDLQAGTKAVDTILPYDNHRDTVARLLTLATPLGTIPTLSASSVIGFEIETDPRRTAVNNATKNADAGVALTIIAVMKDRETIVAYLHETLPPAVQDRTLVANIFDLLSTTEEPA